MTPRSSAKAGFSMLEIVAAVGILVLLAGILVPTISNQMEKSRVARAKVDMTTIAKAFNAYYVDTGIWPANGEFSATVNVAEDFIGFPCFFRNVHSLPNWGGPYLTEGVRINSTTTHVATGDASQGGLRDPWGQPYRVVYVARTSSNPGAVYLYSGGPNRTFNTSAGNMRLGVMSGDDIAVIVTRAY